MNNYIYILVMALTSYFIRVFPLAVIQKQIKNQFIQSFLYYVPYVTLSVMTFPAIVQATKNPIAGGAALVAGIVASYKKVSMVNVAIICCVVVFVLELFI